MSDSLVSSVEPAEPIAPAETVAPAQPVTPFSGFYGDDGLNREAVEALPEEYASMKGMFEKYPTGKDLAGGIKNLQFLASQKSLQRLPADADDAQKHQHAIMVKEYFGVPDHVEGYGVKKPESIPDEMWDKEGTESLLGVLHEHNASPELVQALAAHQLAGIESTIAAAPQARAEEVATINAELQTSFGNELPAVSEAAMKGLAVLGVTIPESGNIADLKISFTEIVAAGQRMTQLVGEDMMSREISRDGGGSAAGSYIEQANAIKTDPANPFNADFTSEDPARQKKAQQEYYRLMSLAEALKK